MLCTTAAACAAQSNTAYRPNSKPSLTAIAACAEKAMVQRSQRMRVLRRRRFPSWPVRRCSRVMSRRKVSCVSSVATAVLRCSGLTQRDRIRSGCRLPSLRWTHRSRRKSKNMAASARKRVGTRLKIDIHKRTESFRADAPTSPARYCLRHRKTARRRRTQAPTRQYRMAV